MIINLYKYKGFQIFNNSFSSQETGLLKLFGIKYNLEIKHIPGIKEYNENYIPLAGTDIMPLIFGYEPVPEYYPDFLSEFLKRKIEYRKSEIKKKEEVFIKPADSRYKRFTGFIKEKHRYCNEKPPFWISEIKYFKSEFRYYITYGKIKAAYQYSGEEEISVPELKFEFPLNYSGAVDFGFTFNNEFLLIEAQHPYSCGWYGSRNEEEIYWQWVIDGFIYMLKK